MLYQDALKIAIAARDLLAPHCERIMIAGSIRRKCEFVKDVEIVAIPKPYEAAGFFESGIATVVNQWPKIKGTLPCKYTQRLLMDKFKLDLFFCTPENWGLILAIRTGSATYSHKVLGRGWVRNGYKSVDGFLTSGGNRVNTPEEKDLFERAAVLWVDPQKRNFNF